MTGASPKKEKTISKKKGRIHIPDTPENVAKPIMRKPPKKDWRFLGKKN